MSFHDSNTNKFESDDVSEIIQQITRYELQYQIEEDTNILKTQAKPQLKVVIEKFTQLFKLPNIIKSSSL